MPVQWGTNPAVSQSVFLLRGLHAARPAAAPANQDYYYLETDTAGGTLFQSTGSAWVQVAGPVTDVDTATFAALTDVDTTGQVDQQPYAWDAGSGKYKPLDGVRGDGSHGLILKGPISAGDFTYAADVGSEIAGSTFLFAQDITLNGTSEQVFARLSGTMTADRLATGIDLSRAIDRAHHVVQGPILFLQNHDDSGGVSPVPLDEPIFQTQGTANTGIVTINDAGGLGLFNATPPTVQPTGGAHTAAGTYGATEQTMLQAVYNAARAIGLLS